MNYVCDCEKNKVYDGGCRYHGCPYSSQEDFNRQMEEEKVSKVRIVKPVGEKWEVPREDGGFFTLSIERGDRLKVIVDRVWRGAFRGSGPVEFWLSKTEAQDLIALLQKANP